MAARKRSGSHTLDTTAIFRCLLVGLEDAQAKACKEALAPVIAVRAETVERACAQMAEVLPLVVIVDCQLALTLGDLSDYATACGAEIVVVDRTASRDALAKSLLDAVRVAEARRVAR